MQTLSVNIFVIYEKHSHFSYLINYLLTVHTCQVFSIFIFATFSSVTRFKYEYFNDDLKIFLARDFFLFLFWKTDVCLLSIAVFGWMMEL